MARNSLTVALILFGSQIIGGPGRVYAKDLSPRLRILPEAGSGTITGLRFFEEKSEWAISPSGSSTGVSERSVAEATLTGDYRKSESGWTLIHDARELISTDGKISEYPIVIHLRLTGPETRLEMTCVGPGGELQREAFRIQAVDWDSISPEATSARESSTGLQAGLTAQFLDLSDARQGRLAEGAIGMRAVYSLEFEARPFKVAGQFDLSLAPLFSGPEGFRFLSSTITAGYRVPRQFGLTKPWQLWAELGLHFGSIFSSRPNFGFQNASGPLAKAELLRDLGVGHSVGATIEFGQIFSRSGIYPLQFHRWGAGADFRRNRGPEVQSWALSLEYSSIALILDGVPIDARALLAGWSTGF